jgi:spore coat protein U-like protein
MTTQRRRTADPQQNKSLRPIIPWLRRISAMAVTCFLLFHTVEPVWAGSKQQNLPVQAQVALNCTFLSAPSLNFLSYDPNGANNTVPLDQATTLQISCTQGATATIGIDAGTHAGQASIGTRALANGTRYLGYDLYQEPTRTVLWTNSGAGLYTYVSASSTPASLNLYGRIFAGQNTPTGIYTDTLVITINY